MKTLTSHTFTRAARESSYEWDKMLDGGIYQLEQGDGKDYECKTLTFCSLIRAAAKKRNKSVRTQAVTDDKGNDKGVIVQAVPLGSLKAAPKSKAPAGKK